MVEHETLAFELYLGKRPGYHHGNKGEHEDVALVYQEEAEALYKDRGIYVSAVLGDHLALYRPEWGCPEGGEEVVVLRGVCNPLYCSDKDGWRHAVHELACRLSQRLRQTTFSLVFMNIRLVYHAPHQTAGG